MPKQQHGAVVLTDFSINNRLENFSDGFATSNTDIGLGVFGSDCPAIALLTPCGFGIVHCGWRGFAGGVVDNLTTAVSSVSSLKPSEMSAFIGPGICRRCYEVDTAVINSCQWPASSFSPLRNGHSHLDLAEAIQQRLLALGVTRVVKSDVCTAHAQNLHSRRHQGPGIVQVFALHYSLGRLRS